MKAAPIAYMDSGIGGLTVVKVALTELPHENLIYLGDEARLPYGQKSAEEVRKFSTEIGQFFVDKGAKMMVIACNTATAAALQHLKKILPIPVVGVIEPGSAAAVKKTKNNRIGVIATNGTVKSHSYRDAIKKLDPSADVVEVGCPSFVTLVEGGKYDDAAAKRIIAEGLEPFKKTGIDTLVLGCTHFPIISNLISQVMGSDVTLVNPGFETVNAVKDQLEEQGELKTTGEPTQQFYTTADVARFDQVGAKWLDEPIHAKLITSEELGKYDEK